MRTYERQLYWSHLSPHVFVETLAHFAMLAHIPNDIFFSENQNMRQIVLTRQENYSDPDDVHLFEQVDGFIKELLYIITHLQKDVGYTADGSYEEQCAVYNVFKRVPNDLNEVITSIEVKGVAFQSQVSTVIVTITYAKTEEEIEALKKQADDALTTELNK